MNEKDDIILEYLDDIGVAEPPAVIHYNLEQQGSEFHVRTTKRRLKRLRELGLVEIVYTEGSYHQITDQGRAYLAGELDVSEMKS